MNINLSKVAKYLPLGVGVAILVIGSLFVPWGEVFPYLINFSPASAVVVLLLGFLFYFGRAVRFWFMLKILNQDMSLKNVIVTYLIAQPISFLPGGEFYRSVMLKKYGNVSLRNGLPSVFAQSLTESLGLLIISVIGAIFLHRYVGVMVGIAVVFALVIAFIKWLSTRKSHTLVNTVPKVDVSLGRVRTFLQKNRVLLSGRNFLLLFATSFISTFAGIAVLMVAANEFGADIGIFQAAIAFALPVILQLVTFIPGGLGVNEQGSVGILALFGISLPLAVAITIVVRAVTLVLGFVLGFLALGFAKVTNMKEYH